jgi:hypothetical protein
MTEQQIRDGFERLDGALVPPPDATELVERRVRVRRRRRRTATVGATALVVVAGVGTAVALTGGDDPARTTAVDQPAATSTLVMTRPDGSTYSFPDVTVSCEPPKGDEDFASGPQRIWATSPRRIQDDRPVVPWLYFQGIVGKIAGDRTFTFPTDWSMDSDEEPMILFVADSEGTGRANEVSSAEAEAAGTVRVVEASCDPEPVLRLAVDMTLGSEVEQNTLGVAGSLG